MHNAIPCTVTSISHGQGDGWVLFENRCIVLFRLPSDQNHRWWQKQHRTQPQVSNVLGRGQFQVQMNKFQVNSTISGKEINKNAEWNHFQAKTQHNQASIWLPCRKRRTLVSLQRKCHRLFSTDNLLMQIKFDVLVALAAVHEHWQLAMQKKKTEHLCFQNLGQRSSCVGVFMMKDAKFESTDFSWFFCQQLSFTSDNSVAL